MTTTTGGDSWRKWSPAAQEKALELLRAKANASWRPFFCTVADCNGKVHGEWQWSHARRDQRPPTDADWLVWLLMSGRGAGKTRTGSEITHLMTRYVGRIALVAPTGADVRDIMLEGQSGIITTAPPNARPNYEPSKRRLTWPNGCVATTFSAEEPDRLRGPEHGFAWLDEPAHWPLVQECWDNLMFGLRLGTRPRVICTTTPKPRPWLKNLLAESTTRLSRASTYDNLDNLAPTFAEQIIKKYEGTRLGRQELHAEILEDVEGALWTWDMVERNRVSEPPMEFERVVVAVDPAGSKKRSADETGIVVGGILSGHVYVLADRSGHYSPVGWANAVMSAYEEFSADAIVVETNYGGDMVVANLRAVNAFPHIIDAKARRGKALRAEPVVGKYEQNMVHHAGVFPNLEQQMCEWQPYIDKDSPDRVDALVYCVSVLAKASLPASIGNPSRLRLVAGG